MLDCRSEKVDNAACAGEDEESRQPRSALSEEQKAEKLGRTIFVGNLPVKLKPKLLKKTFSQ